MTNEWSAYAFDIGVAYKEDIDRVVRVLKETGKTMREDEKFSKLILEDIEIFGVDQFADSAVVIKGRIKTKPICQWEVGREFLRRVKYAFDQNNIEIPFPHRTVYFGEDSKPFNLFISENLNSKKS
jgi:small conductance mechanosensitive channel